MALDDLRQVGQAPSRQDDAVVVEFRECARNLTLGVAEL